MKKGFFVVIISIVALVCLFCLDWGNLNWKGFSAGSSETNSVSSDEPWYAFYNLALLSDDNPDNNFNFGEWLADYVENPTAADFDADLRGRMEKDPKLGAAVIAWMDAKVGTRFLGTFYEECKENWATTINTAAEIWMEDKADYEGVLEEFFAFLDTCEVSLRKGNDIHDQMYMNPYTKSGIPDVIVFKTDHESGTFLVYTVNIKGNPVEVEYRTECGYQPTNVEKVMNITPKERPSSSKETVEKTPTPSKPGKPSTPDDEPDKPDKSDESTPKDKKDPTKGTQGELVAPNDNPGPGSDTNNGVGAKHSKEQTKDGSIFQKSYDDYKKVVDDKKKENTTNKSSKPTSTEPAPKEADNPTPVSPPAEKASGGNVSDDGAGESWGGPSDAGSDI